MLGVGVQLSLVGTPGIWLSILPLPSSYQARKIPSAGNKSFSGIWDDLHKGFYDIHLKLNF